MLVISNWFDRAPSGQQTALHLACQRGHTDAVKALLHYGAATDYKDVLGRTPLLAAVE